MEAGVNGEGKGDRRRKEQGKESDKEQMRAPRRNSWDIPTFMKQSHEQKGYNKGTERQKWEDTRLEKIIFHSVCTKIFTASLLGVWH